MQPKRCNFEVDNYRLVEENSNSQFATLEIDVCRSGENSHRMPIPPEAIEASASSIKGKPVLASFQFADTDFGGHDFDEQAVGFFVEEEPQIIEREHDGKPEKYIRANAKIWKKYFANAMDIFKRKDGRSDVSMEIDMLDFQEPDFDGKNGYINLFSITGCTLLGVKPAIQGAEARVLSFSEIKNEYDKESSGSDVEKFATERKGKMAEKTYKINKTELKDTPWGDVDKTEMRNKIMKAINKATLVKSVYALVEDGWQDAPSQHLKYPIMQLVGDTFYYNRGALASALAYAKQENETAVISKVEKLYKKFKLNEDEGGDDKDMAEIEKKMSEDEVLEEKQEFEDTEVMQDNVEMSENEEMAADNEEDMCGTKMEDEETFADDDKEVEKADENDEPDDADPEGSDEDAEDFSEDKSCAIDEVMEDGEVDMALDVNNYAGAMLEMLKAENDEQRQEARKLGLSDDEKLNVIMEECYSIACELGELRKFRQDTIDEKTTFEVSQILASVKQDLPMDKYAELEAEAKACSFDGIEQFRQKAKAFAYDNGVTKGAKKQETHIRMGYDFGYSRDENLNVFAQILNK